MSSASPQERTMATALSASLRGRRSRLLGLGSLIGAVALVTSCTSSGALSAPSGAGSASSSAFRGASVIGRGVACRFGSSGRHLSGPDDRTGGHDHPLHLGHPGHRRWRRGGVQGRQPRRHGQRLSRADRRARRQDRDGAEVRGAQGRCPVADGSAVDPGVRRPGPAQGLAAGRCRWHRRPATGATPSGERASSTW